MKAVTSKRALIMYVLEVLKEHSDEQHPLSQLKILELINNTFMLKCERKAIGYNIDCLIELGFDIVKVNNKGFYLGSRDFEPSEATFLADAIFSSKVINSSYAQALATKVFANLSKYQRRQYGYIYKADEVNRTDNRQIFLNIDLLHEAIENKKQVAFVYTKYNRQATPIGSKRTVSPYFLFNSQGKYYLACCVNGKEDISNFRIDRMVDLQLTDINILPVTQLQSYANGIDIAKYVNENIYAFGGKTVTATLQIFDDNAITYVYDWFADATVFQTDGNVYAKIKCNEQALVYWALQYGESIEVLSPDTVRNKIKANLDIMLTRYK